MKLSPLDIYNKEFKKAAFGYNVSEVNEFLDEVGVAYEKLMKEINSLQDQNERLEEKLKNYENIEDKLKETLTSVQDTAREQTRQAKREADMIIQKANMRAEQIVDKTKKELQKEYQSIQQLKEIKELFSIRFKSLLESHLKMLEENDKLEEVNMDDIAVSKEINLDE